MPNEPTRRDREREVRRAEIIEASDKLFIKQGFEGTSMEDIAKASQFTKRTIYQYFMNKEDLFFAVALRYVYGLDAYFREIFKKYDSALEKIKFSGLAYYQFYKDHPDIFKLINYNPPNSSDKEISPYYKEFMKSQDSTFSMYRDTIAEGKKEGCISLDLDEKKAAHFIVISIIAFLNQMASAKNVYFSDKGLEKDDFINYGISMITETLTKKAQ